MKDFLTKELADIREAGLYKEERIITTPQRADIEVKPEAEVLNFCANNYLGLSNNEQLIEGAVNAMKQRGYGMSSVRFICGTQDIHKQLEAAISDYFQTETPFSTQAASMPTADCLNLCWAKATLSSATR